MSAEMIERVRDSFIFVFDDSVPASDVAQEARRLTETNNGRLIHTYSHTIRGFAARVPAEAAARMASSNPNIAYFEQDQIAYPFPPPWCRDNPDDPRCGGDDGGGDSGTTSPSEQIPWGVARVNGGVVRELGTAWVIDTGVDLDHPDLNVDTSRSRNFVSRGKDQGADDPDGHGTHVAGTIAAIDNDIGVIGVAAGATLVSVRVLGRNGGTYSDVIAGVDYVGANGSSGDVANMSLGGGKSNALNNAVVTASSSGVVFVIAAGNSSAEAKNYSPASANGPNIVTVAASTQADGWASYSNYGTPDPVDWIAPGSGVLSTYKSGGYATLSGTSMAAPHVSGVILLGGCRIDGSIVGPDAGTYSICVY
jgi:hypothetical protein